MTDNRWLVQVRAALVQYLRQLMRVEVDTISTDPRAQQIMIENMDGIKR
jgi:hypothetical protein